MSYILNKPYTDKQYADFVVEYNHNKGLAIEETETAVYALEANEIMQDGVPIVNPNYEDEQIKERKENFEKEFINTLWGWYRKQPKGYANAPQSVDIIFNMVNVLGSFTQDVSNLMIFYTQPDFSKEEQCTEEWLIANQIRKEPCTKEEFMQFYVDFQTRWANEQYKIEGVSNDTKTDRA